MIINYPIRILSDIHFGILGGRIKTIDHLRSHFADAKTIIFNGDTVEQLSKGTIEANRHLDLIRNLARELAVDLIFLRGNHDPENGLYEFEFSHKGRLIRLNHGDFGVLQLSNRPYAAWKRPIEFGIYFLKTLKTYPVYWRQIEMAFNRIGQADIFILGHTHFPSVTRRGQRTVVNLGAHMRGFKRAFIEIRTPESDIVFHSEQTIAI